VQRSTHGCRARLAHLAPPFGGSVDFILWPKTTGYPTPQAFSSPLAEKWIANQFSDHTLGNRPSTHDPFLVGPKGVHRCTMRPIFACRELRNDRSSPAPFHCQKRGQMPG